MKLYHGTSATHTEAILSKGIMPRSYRKGRSQWTHTVHSASDRVYLTTAYPLYFAANALADTDSYGLVVEVDTDRLSKEHFLPDEDFLEQYHRVMGDDLPPDWNMKKRTIWYRNNAGLYRWRPSVEAMGTCAYLGVIPARAITRYALVPVNHKLWLIAMDPTITLINYRLMGIRYRNLVHWVFNDLLEFAETPLDSIDFSMLSREGIILNEVNSR